MRKFLVYYNHLDATGQPTGDTGMFELEASDMNDVAEKLRLEQPGFHVIKIVEIEDGVAKRPTIVSADSINIFSVGDFT